jgi:hypothetical protein
VWLGIIATKTAALSGREHEGLASHEGAKSFGDDDAAGAKFFKLVGAADGHNSQIAALPAQLKLKAPASEGGRYNDA